MRAFNLMIAMFVSLIATSAAVADRANTISIVVHLLFTHSLLKLLKRLGNPLASARQLLSLLALVAV